MDPYSEPGVPAGLLPPFDKAMQRNYAAGHMCKAYAHDSTQTKSTLIKDAQIAAGLLRSGPVETVYNNLAHGHATQGKRFIYDSQRSVAKGGATPGRTPMHEVSPQSVKRAKTALRGAGSQREAVDMFNVLADEEAGHRLGEKNTSTLMSLAGTTDDDEGPMKAHRRVRRPMVTAKNRADRLAMAKVIYTAARRNRYHPDRWSFAKDTMVGDQFMVAMGSGDLETKWEYRTEAELPTPISIAKSPSKIMLHAWVSWEWKSELVWCNQFGSLKGEATWATKFWTALTDAGCEDDNHDDCEACMNCEACLKANRAAGNSFEECLEALKPGMVDDSSEPKKGASVNQPRLKVWMDGATCQWTKESIKYLEEECLAPRSSPEEMALGKGSVLFATEHPQKRSPGSAADGSAMDSGVIRHFKIMLRRHLAKLDGGRRQVLDKEVMYGICCEVWDAIPVEDLRKYMTKCEKTWGIIREKGGAWVGWEGGDAVRHGVG